MAPNAKRVFYVEYLSSPLYAQVLAQRPDVQLDRLENKSPEEVATPILSAAHVYQAGASRQVIAKHYHAAPALLDQTPNLIAASSNGAGYDPVDVAACTARGIIVVNQSGGNKEGVAEHALAMMLTLSKRIIETDRRMRAGAEQSAQRLYRPRVLKAARWASSASAMSAVAWPSCAAACSTCACWPTTPS